MRSILLGVSAAFFFAFTFVLNRSMDLSGGSWMWTASLRFIFMVPLLGALVLLRGKFRTLIQEMRKNPKAWLLWSFLGFGLFYAPLCIAAAYGPGWLIAGTWQITIISGSLLVPLFYETIHTSGGTIKRRGIIPWKGLSMSLLILAGIILMQIQHAQNVSVAEVLMVLIPVLIASFAYPLGNRKMMEVCEGRLDAFERVLGMTIASLPIWILLAVIAFVDTGMPSSSQTFQSFVVALASGVIATVLFFKATDMVKGDMQRLASVEATQSLAVVFTLIGEISILSGALPPLLSWIGVLLVVIGMVLHSYNSRRKSNSTKNQKQTVSA
ncbi:multidrug resistance efflux transporter family protein [Ammoniphilus sp. CFH 90114]|uniref:DMT family transporter n=1 Tax=Ammoniphilus sp. CFH 90114 TaxID=2493665 RepID=UPI00100DE25B|nr:multidrug resistance efflux transporter family protein [Ammoniphilus sp. CFH 90114]RXT13745.1 multidrug resistance efflux transporter family protein [Ammoniphilus sp. CFH 90114]